MVKATLYLMAILSGLMIPENGIAQESSSDLDLEEYRIVGKDTRTFMIIGDRSSTIEFLPQDLYLPEEVRGIETSQGLIDNENRLFREDDFGAERGLYGTGDIVIGSDTPTDAWIRASKDMDGSAITVDLDSRMAEEHTLTNQAPSTHDLSVTGYYGGLGTRYSVSLGIVNENDELFGEKFRNREREAGRYSASLTMRNELGSWDMAAAGSIVGGGFKDPEFGYDEDELNFSGDVTLTGELSALTVVSDTDARYFKFGDDNGSAFTTSVKGKMLLWDSFALRFGAGLSASALPDEDTEVWVYPEAGFDWAMSRRVYLKGSFRPHGEFHSHGDLHDRNGLLAPLPMLFENHKIEAESELGWNFAKGGLFRFITFGSKTENALIFDKAGSFFTCIGNNEVDVNGFRFGASYEKGDRWGIDGLMTFRDISWDKTGDVPYETKFETRADGYYTLFGVWRITGRMTVMGEHYIQSGSTDTEDGFMILDCGVERDFLKNLTATFELRNLTNTDASWWTPEYEIPGAGMYGGLKARF